MAADGADAFDYGDECGAGDFACDVVGLVVASEDLLEPMHRHGHECVDAGKSFDRREVCDQEPREGDDELGIVVVLCDAEHPRQRVVVAVGEQGMVCLDEGRPGEAPDEVVRPDYRGLYCGGAKRADVALVGEELSAAT